MSEALTGLAFGDEQRPKERDGDKGGPSPWSSVAQSVWSRKELLAGSALAVAGGTALFMAGRGKIGGEARRLISDVIDRVAGDGEFSLASRFARPGGSSHAVTGSSESAYRFTDRYLQEHPLLRFPVTKTEEIRSFKSAVSDNLAAVFQEPAWNALGRARTEAERAMVESRANLLQTPEPIGRIDFVHTYRSIFRDDPDALSRLDKFVEAQTRHLELNSADDAKVRMALLEASLTKLQPELGLTAGKFVVDESALPSSGAGAYHSGTGAVLLNPFHLRTGGLDVAEVADVIGHELWHKKQDVTIMRRVIDKLEQDNQVLPTTEQIKIAYSHVFSGVSTASDDFVSEVLSLRRGTRLSSEDAAWADSLIASHGTSVGYRYAHSVAVLQRGLLQKAFVASSDALESDKGAATRFFASELPRIIANSPLRQSGSNSALERLVPNTSGSNLRAFNRLLDREIVRYDRKLERLREFYRMQLHEREAYTR